MRIGRTEGRSKPARSLTVAHCRPRPLRAAGLWTSCRGTVTVWVAVSAVPMLTLLGATLTIAQLSLGDAELQSIADAAALAGAMRYNATGKSYPAVCGTSGARQACAATSAAADLGEINGLAAGTRAWNNSTEILTDGSLSAALIAGPVQSTDSAVHVTITRAIAGIPSLGEASSYNSTVSAVAELELGANTSPYACVAALAGYGQINSNVDLTINSGANISLTNCSLRSDEAVMVNSGSTVTASGVYAASTITVNGSPTLNTSLYPNDGQIADPFASNTALQNALGAAATYSSITLNSNQSLTLNAGLTVVSGNVTIDSGATLSGTGVTLIVNGSLNLNTGGTLNLTASSTSSGGAVPGVAFAGKSTSIALDATAFITGAVYFPDASFYVNSGATFSSPHSCLELVGAQIFLDAASTLSTSGCSAYGTQPFRSLPSTYVSVLVQ